MSPQMGREEGPPLFKRLVEEALKDQGFPKLGVPFKGGYRGYTGFRV